MSAKDRLLAYFTEGLAPLEERSIGIEVETQFVDAHGIPITREQSEAIIRAMYWRWERDDRQFQLTPVSHPSGHILSYELGRHNLELSFAPGTATTATLEARARLAELYEEAARQGARPFFGPIIEMSGDVLAIPDDRDATWVRLDTRPVLNLLASTSAVQFTIDVSPAEAILMLNRLGESIDRFLMRYPQEARWREYIKQSPARYRPDRYGGPLRFSSLEDYCDRLLQHPVVDRNAGKLTDHEVAGKYEISLFLRSVWWYFRLRRYGNQLCIEVRPIPRCRDDVLQEYLNMVLGIMLGDPWGAYGGGGH